MSEWVTGQPAVSGYFLKLFYPLSLLLIAYSQIFLIFSGGLLSAALRCAAVQSCSVREADVSERRGAAADGRLLGGGARSGGGARAA